MKTKEKVVSINELVISMIICYSIGVFMGFLLGIQF